jgi:hypothetical protein
MSNGLVVGGLYDGDKVVEASTAYWATTSQPKSVISWFTSSKRSGSLCNVRRPSGVSVLNKIYVCIAPSSFADQSCKATDLFPASRGVHSNLSASGKPASSRTVSASLAGRRFRCWPTASRSQRDCENLPPLGLWTGPRGSWTNAWASASLLNGTWPTHAERIVSYLWPKTSTTRADLDLV